jgi:hypothetical protein
MPWNFLTFKIVIKQHKQHTRIDYSSDKKRAQERTIFKDEKSRGFGSATATTVSLALLNLCP